MSVEMTSKLRDAVVLTAEKHDGASLNDVCGALTSALAFYLSAIPDIGLRAQIIDTLHKMLEVEIQRYLAAGFAPQVDIRVIDPERGAH